MSAPLYRVSGFAGPRHPRALNGAWLGTTEHASSASKDAEVAAWRTRIQRGDALYCIVLEVATGRVERIE